jgi:hypothetical protein
VEKYGRARQATVNNVIGGMRIAYWITKATETHSEYAVLTVFPRQQWLRERASVLRLYLHCMSCSPSPKVDFFGRFFRRFVQLVLP